MAGIGSAACHLDTPSDRDGDRRGERGSRGGDLREGCDLLPRLGVLDCEPGGGDGDTVRGGEIGDDAVRDGVLHGRRGTTSRGRGREQVRGGGRKVRDDVQNGRGIPTARDAIGGFGDVAWRGYDKRDKTN